MELKEALTKALEFEKKGYEIYTATANRTKNPIVKKTFHYLAKQEQHHIKEINEYVEANHKINEIELEGDTLKETKEFFNTTVKEFKEKTEATDDDIKAHETALELENNAYNFYKEQLENTSDEDVKKFLTFLMEQENAHYEFVQKTLDYIKDPQGFYTREEGWILEG